MSSDPLVNRSRAVTPTGSRPVTPTGMQPTTVWQPIHPASAQQRLISSNSKNVQNSPQSEHTSGRGTNESSSDSSGGGLGRATPPLKPMGLPKSNVQLVPGRMASGNKSSNISSTAV